MAVVAQTDRAIVGEIVRRIVAAVDPLSPPPSAKGKCYMNDRRDLFGVRRFIAAFLAFGDALIKNARTAGTLLSADSGHERRLA